jgi:hypothetical protein
LQRNKKKHRENGAFFIPVGGTVTFCKETESNQRVLLRGSGRNFRVASISVRRLFLRKRVEELCASSVRCIAAFDPV